MSQYLSTFQLSVRSPGQHDTTLLNQSTASTGLSNLEWFSHYDTCNLDTWINSPHTIEDVSNMDNQI